MISVTVPWTSVESRNALNIELAEEDIAASLETADANTWGFLRLPNGKALAVGYANLGLRPVAVLFDSHIFIGINELLAGYNVETLAKEFIYKMPGVFHEFVSLAEQLIVRDEIGFVGISLNGIEQWKKLFSGPIDKFKIEENSIKGCTIDGEEFSFSLSLLQNSSPIRVVGMDPSA